MTSRPRSAPDIPDHEMLHMIGGGSYGQVFLARTVTGVLRAVKVVWREDFDDARTFEREFDGILKYEPLSRDHPGLVSVLHIGRSLEEGRFYYYVMELGDDIAAGQDFDIEHYQARTLRSDMKAAKGAPLPVDDVLTVARSLASALGFLHDAGLAHRDVKPSNVIFVGGEAMLADIGLVAAAGGRTFVGTEGFVPPEGPGTAQADLYSLGKVLYEMASGKDRLEFPELPDKLPEGDEKKRWLALNHVICDVCEPRLSQRTITTAGELQNRLRAISQRRNGTSKRKIFLCAALIALAGWLALTELGQETTVRAVESGRELIIEQFEEEEPDAEVTYGTLLIQSQPEEGAEILDSEGIFLGRTPSRLENLIVGREYAFTLRLEGFRDTVVTGSVADEVLIESMRREAPPEIDKPWRDSLGLRYGPQDESHVSYQPVLREMYEEYLTANDLELDGAVVETSLDGEKTAIVAVTEDAAWAFTEWLTELCRRKGVLTEEFLLDPVFIDDPAAFGLTQHQIDKGLRPFRCEVYRYTYGVLFLRTEPPGATILIDGELQDEVTPALISALRPGRLQVELSLDGFKPESHLLRLESGGEAALDLKLTSSKSVNFSKTWMNSLEMPMEPIAPDLLVGRYEVRVQDYAAYIAATDVEAPPETEFEQGPTHPVVNVQRSDAEAFCLWLTEKERAEELLGASHEYRLPTDAEWSLMVGREEDLLLTPRERSDLAAKRGLEGFPWGPVFPPLSAAGTPLANVADATLASEVTFDVQRTILNYDDGYAYTSPVGAFGIGPSGLCDLAGNANEWVSDAFGREAGVGTLRGGGWNTSQRQNLELGWRSAVPPNVRNEYYGFRVVLTKVPPKAQRIEEPVEFNFDDELLTE